MTILDHGQKLALYGSLTPGQQETINRLYREGYTAKEIMDETNLGPVVVETAIHLIADWMTPAELNQRIHAASMWQECKTVPPNTRECIADLHDRGYRVEDIAAITGVQPSHVAGVLFFWRRV